jgi:Rad3-related DNA helicase
VIIASRDHVCRSSEINQKKKIKGCAFDAACKNSKCEFRSNIDESRKMLKLQKEYDKKHPKKAVVADIEEFEFLEQIPEICHFYANKDLAQAADLILTPYNYIIDSKIMKSLDINFSNTIIIFD